MGKSADFSEGIRLIRAAHSDAAAVLAKWRDLIESPGEVTLSLKMEDGTTQETTLPSIREAITRYLGGAFEQITLSNGMSAVTIRLNADGHVEMVLPDGRYAGIAAGDVIAAQIIGANGTLPIIGDVILQNGKIQTATIQSLKVGSGSIKNAAFSGEVSISGNCSVSGEFSIRRLSADALSAGSISCGKQVMKFAVEGIRDASLNRSDGDIFTGDVSVLEAAGIRSEPTWADCMYSPEGLHAAANTIHVYWGLPGFGDIPLMNFNGTYDFSPEGAAIWPYKMYEKVDGGYRIRWLPLEDSIGRIHFARTGPGSSHGALPSRIEEAVTASGPEARIAQWSPLVAYSCPRYMAAFESRISSGAAISTNLLYRM